MEWQLRNWYYFTWLSGDFNVEQHVHMLDVATWLLGGRYPARAYGSGGRTVRTGDQYGNIYDHHSTVYEYDGGLRANAHCRQYPGCHNDVGVTAIGTRGRAILSETVQAIEGRRRWESKIDKGDMYQAEHEAFFRGIRSGSLINAGEYMAKSTLLGIMGRSASYSGQLVTWDDTMASTERLGPARYEWGKLDAAPIAVPRVKRS
jgi:predicted dehydrogenase